MATLGRDTTVTWLGHGTLYLRTPGGKNLLVDPWIEGNPAFPPEWAERVRSETDIILLTHAHFDHIADLISIAQSSSATVACIYDLAGWLEGKGIAGDKIVGFNKGGTVTIGGVRVTMTNAHHSNTLMDDGKPLTIGSEAGYVLRLENDFCVYISGDTCVTYDMLIIGDLYRPELAILPIGDHFTMDPRQAAYAMKLLRAPYVIPCHYGTFPILTGTPEQLRIHLDEFGVTAEVIAIKPGESVS